MSILHESSSIPEVTDLTITFNGANDATCYWSWPRKLSSEIYSDQAYWTGEGLADFVSSLVNNGELSDVAWRWTVGGASYLIFDAGPGNTREFCEVWYSYDSTVPGDAPSFWCADDPAGPWTSINLSPSGLTKTIAHAGSDIVTAVRRFGAAVGGHRCWRGGKGNVAAPGAFTEMWFRESREDYEDAEAFLIYDGGAGAGATPGLHVYIASNKVPTATDPLNLAALVRVSSTFSDIAESLTFEIRVLSRLGESVGWRYTSSIGGANGTFRRSDFRVHGSVAVDLVAGLNSNIPAASGPRDLVVAGVTGNFSVGGFLRGDPNGTPAGTPVVFVGGEIFRLWNWYAYTMTVVNEDALSDAANRIKTFAGANVNIVGSGYAEFEYDASQSRWIYTTGRDSTGYR